VLVRTGVHWPKEVVSRYESKKAGKHAPVSVYGGQEMKIFNKFVTRLNEQLVHTRMFEDQVDPAEVKSIILAWTLAWGRKKEVYIQD